MRSNLNDSLSKCNNPCLGYFRLARKDALPGGSPEEKTKHLKDVCKIATPDSYAVAFESYRDALKSVPDCTTMTVETTSPLAFGLAEKGVFDTGLRFMRPFGIPTISGSALKGAVRRLLSRRLALTQALASRLESDTKGEVFRSDLPLSKIREIDRQKSSELEAWAQMFGFVGSKDELGAAGTVDFLDAWMCPQRGPFLKLDIVNPHHPKYYRGKDTLPHEWDEPIPAHFLCVKTKIRFLVAFRAPEEWRALTLELIKGVLVHEGIGGKTNVGYGRFKFVE